jgi:peptide/nickel transport system substrate-binding protein
LIQKSALLIEPVPAPDVQRVNAADGVEVVTPDKDPRLIEDLRIVFLGFDVTHDQLKNSDAEGNPFKNKDVRTAFYQAINVEQIRSLVLRGFALPTGSLITPSLSPPAGKLRPRPFNPDGARKLLEGAGYPDGFTLEMDCPIGLYIGDEEICKNVRDMLSYIHVTVNLKARPKDKFLGKVLQSGGYDTSFFLYGWSPESFDVWNVLFNLVACRDTTAGAGRFNIGGCCDADLDALIGKIRTEPMGTSRDALVLQALQKIYDETVYIPLHEQELIWGASKDFTFVQRKNNRVFFNEIQRK